METFVGKHHSSAQSKVSGLRLLDDLRKVNPPPPPLLLLLLRRRKIGLGYGFWRKHCIGSFIVPFIALTQVLIFPAHFRAASDSPAVSVSVVYLTSGTVMTCFCFLISRAKTSDTQAVESAKGIKSVKIYSYKELRDATKGFSPANKVGEGGFGSVYKGKLKDGTIAAIKVLSPESSQGAQEFLTEITVISDIVHENLVRLYGCCVEGKHRILVYNYLENNSLAQTLLGCGRSNIQFDWRTRSKICIGVARGLAFLHEDVRTRIVHRDIKASNILLDKDLTPKISDFGLAKFFPASMTHVSTKVAGTIGYLAPEYAIQGKLTRKADIYSFGILLLEIVSGRCNTNSRLHIEDQFILERSDRTHGILVLRTWTLYESNELASIIDASLHGEVDADEACRFLKVGLLCTQDNPKLRPPMSTVVRMLTGERDVNLETITRPGLIYDFMDLKVRSQNKICRKQKKNASKDCSAQIYEKSDSIDCFFFW